MRSKKKLKLSEMSREDGQRLVHLENNELMLLPAPLNDPAQLPPFQPLSAQAAGRYECILDDTCAVFVPKPKSKEEEQALIGKFLAGLEKLFQRENNWTFLQPLILTMEHCAKCQTCSEACHIYRGERAQ